MKERQNRFTRFIDDVSGALVGVMMLVTFAQVVFRYVFKAPLPWSEEIARYLLIWAAMVGSVAAMSTGEHIDIDTFVNLLPSKGRKVLWQFRNLLVMAFLTVILWYGVRFSQINGAQMSPTVPWLSMFWPSISISVGAALMIVYVIRDILKGPK